MDAAIRSVNIAEKDGFLAGLLPGGKAVGDVLLEALLSRYSFSISFSVSMESRTAWDKLLLPILSAALPGV